MINISAKGNNNNIASASTELLVIRSSYETVVTAADNSEVLD